MKQRRKKSKAPEEPVKLDWRIVALIVVPLLIAGVAFATYVTAINGPKKLTDADRAMLRDYDGIRAALFRDDLSVARKASEVFVQTHGDASPFTPHAITLSKAPTLDAARIAFSQMSEEATKLAYKHSEFIMMGCSMDQCPVECPHCRMNEYANWVQVQREVENPYMGTASPRCGIVKPW
ncbi:MAG: hypothetical protein ABI680_08410 [Chthoniobacteraceae bacterium]